MLDHPLRLLRWAVRLTACGLVLFAVVSVLREGRVTEAVGGVLLGLLYAAGAAFEGRPSPARVWLGLVTAGWLVLAVTAPPFVWVVFPLLFAYPQVLPLWAAMFGVTVLTSVTIAVSAWHAGGLSVPVLLGPGGAAVVVTMLALVCRALRADPRLRP
ncbi:hypothetical protein [Nonomuraea aridisoli]|uniref:Sensor histidine kinase n=1 Tax=Nonomuraea aridisoli TaxID=2070368 RepID=A0A2W2F852_9ACTN|nr:hypothetical protein [Nonomuraea aridisoli]PZG21238.1 hypothetical protein C1J01_07215 [Nonomuraea aridisoli]